MIKKIRMKFILSFLVTLFCLSGALVSGDTVNSNIRELDGKTVKMVTGLGHLGYRYVADYSGADGLLLWTRHGNKNQSWKLELDEATDTYTIKSVSSNKYLSESTSKTVIFSDRATDASRWKINKKTSSVFEIVNNQTGNLLDVLDEKVGDGVKIQTWARNGTKAQLWSLEDDSYVTPEYNKEFTFHRLNDDGGQWSLSNEYSSYPIGIFTYVDLRYYYNIDKFKIISTTGKKGDVKPGEKFYIYSVARDAYVSFQMNRAYLSNTKTEFALSQTADGGYRITKEATSILGGSTSSPLREDNDHVSDSNGGILNIGFKILKNYIYVEDNVPSFDNKTYNIVTEINQKSVMDMSVSKEDTVHLYNSGGATNKQWKFTLDQKTNSYTIMNMHDSAKGKYLSEGSNNKLIFETTISNRSRWKVVSLGDDVYAVINYSTGNLIDVLDSGTNNGTVIQTWKRNGEKAQKWRFQEVISNVSDFDKRTIAVTTDLNKSSVMTNSGGNKPVIAANREDEKQEWKFLLDKESDTYTITTVNNGTLLYLQELSAGNLVLSDTAPSITNLGNDKRWKVMKVDDDLYEIVNYNTKNRVAVANGSTVEGNAIQTEKTNSSSSQRWILNDAKVYRSLTLGRNSTVGAKGDPTSSTSLEMTSGSVATITAKPAASGWKFVRFDVKGSGSSIADFNQEDRTVTFKMGSENASVTAVYQQEPRFNRLEFYSNSQLTQEIKIENLVEKPQSQWNSDGSWSGWSPNLVNISPSTPQNPNGKRFVGWEVGNEGGALFDFSKEKWDLNSMLSDGTVKINEAFKFYAKFENVFELSIVGSPSNQTNEDIKVDGSLTMATNEKRTITAGIPINGYRFYGFRVSGEGSKLENVDVANGTATFIMGTANATIEARYELPLKNEQIFDGKQMKFITELNQKSVMQDSETDVLLWSVTDKEDQVWELSLEQDGNSYTILNILSNKYLSETSKNRLAFTEELSLAGDAAKWQIVEVGDDVYEFVNYYSGNRLEVSGSSTNNGTLIVPKEKNDSRAQHWKLEDFTEDIAYSDNNVQELDGKTVHIVTELNQESVLDVPMWSSYGAYTQVKQKSDISRQKWTFKLDKETDTYSIYNNDEKWKNYYFYYRMGDLHPDFISYPEGEQREGVTQWKVIRVGRDTFEIVNYDNGMRLGVGASLYKGEAHVDAQQKNGTISQHWRFEEVKLRCFE